MDYLWKEMNPHKVKCDVKNTKLIIALSGSGKGDLKDLCSP